jgi:putative flippase GtrA
MGAIVDQTVGDAVRGVPVAWRVVSPTTVSDVLAAAFDRRGLAARYGAVSGLNLANHQIVLNVAYLWFGWGGGVSNVTAAVVAAVPAYLLSRHWVWGVRGGHSLRGEIVPFWGLALAGVVVSTALAESADRVFATGLWVAGASLFGYFVVWVLKFLILDRLFRRSTRRLAGQHRPGL